MKEKNTERMLSGEKQPKRPYPTKFCPECGYKIPWAPKDEGEK